MSYAANAYARISRSAMSPRETEAAVLIKAAQQLQSVRDNWVEQAGALPHAIQFNQKLWTILATAATDPASPLPADVRQGVANLAVFVFRRMVDTLAEPAAEKLTALISINHNLAAGLGGR
ncbi:flagellar biosynthesis regulator FlaF [Methylobacterium sp. NEAU 140]|uniref:flagellar biosynthesis regulator FlaF n=1 Tax=Methylobacterium sp. NEAU 140 TaxID=3064945 RepID=UPI002733CA63|nr:flagellar biosynthesis regulator FlaF [Methylobacterium sp. NEAU 140]MDP4021212.1 flagellar biosynthesis regulator FlaF [Methylobacterium sp. NEAU 140]